MEKRVWMFCSSHHARPHRAHGASFFAAGVAVLVTVFRRAPSPIRSRAGGATPLWNGLVASAAAHTLRSPHHPHLASAMVFGTPVAAAADARLVDDATVRARCETPGRRSTSTPSSSARGRVRTPAGSMFSASFLGSGAAPGRRRAGRDDDFGAAAADLGGGHGRDSSSGAGARGFRGGAAAAVAARRASSRAETGVPPPRHPGLPRAADDDLVVDLVVVVVAAATVLRRFRSSRRAVGARVFGSGTAAEVDGGGWSAEVPRADASTDVHHRSSVAESYSARDGGSGVGGASGTAGVFFASRSDAALASSRALARARASASFSARVTSRGGSTIRRRSPSTNAPTSSASRMAV